MKNPVPQYQFYIASIIIALLNLFVVLFAKYNINGLSLAEFNISYVGNLINIILTILIGTGLLIQSLNSRNCTMGFSILSFSMLYLGTSIFFLFIGFNDIQFGTFPLFNYPPQKMIMGILAIVSTLIQAYITIFVWGMLIYKGNYLYIKSFTFLMFLSFVAVAFAAIYTFAAPQNDGEKIDKNHYEYAIVLGAAVWNKEQPSPLFKGRIITAQNLLKKQIVDKIQLTGGNAPGEISEAKTAFNYLINHGVDKAILSIEENTRTTVEQIEYLKFRGAHNVSEHKFLIISDSFHLVRVKEMCKFFGVQADTYSSEYPVSDKNMIYYTLRDSVGLLLFWLFAI